MLLITSISGNAMSSQSQHFKMFCYKRINYCGFHYNFSTAHTGSQDRSMSQAMSRHSTKVISPLIYRNNMDRIQLASRRQNEKLDFGTKTFAERLERERYAILCFLCVSVLPLGCTSTLHPPTTDPHSKSTSTRKYGSLGGGGKTVTYLQSDTEPGPVIGIML